LKEKSFRFAVRIVNLYKHLCEEKKEFVLSKQALRSGKMRETVSKTANFLLISH
jgi:four helix bundle protein